MNKKDLEKLGLTAEALEKAGLDADVTDKIIVLHGKDIEGHKATIKTLGEEKDELDGQLTEANKQIDAFKEIDPEGIKEAASKWEQKAKDFEAKVTETAVAKDKEMAQLRFDHALDSALSDAKAKSPKAVKALLKLDDMKLSEDGSIVGLSDQLEKVQEENDYLFTSEEDPPSIVMGGNNQTVNENNFSAAMRKGAGLSEAKEG